MKKIYYLSTCSTCKRILSALEIPSSFVLQDIKTNPLTEKELEALKELSGSYEALFSKRAQLYIERNLKRKSLIENDYKTLILEHYTFLKRPVIIMDQFIFIGNAKATIEQAKIKMHE
ncbi:MAG: hypothetical protein COZ75_07420 [Flavobacteriaceae bacterium CG_4_8_14_3_um_filter_34_10]|nr:hypothetical protein [Flavobacteriia bacterium]OIP51295.1 MAG: hypothetical protein AUK33_04895 [Flavobacteriaceae bacterium CG2_30_34_30]PIQ18701.1 MAG: hypothetical protein COW66_05035 [Flavobacteriaceae bacterium CG18_big_fil_WC_8_21_14_2_50_34_36]PIV48749.1 MAG: hypothetical protein COS19_12155 [Flavobacteriaceae bacterium CG02_land_8_20_14_3_00_34_13]PIX09324.1 MAG: hypothetical protein COZ75_07420 [Flavobacteriaceae bacterium CG_4_8_14_3_um_filter_34_10]PIZ08144.1 MAG: hypothetical pr